MESVQSTPDKPVEKRRSRKGVLVRWAVAAVVTGALAAIAYAPWQAFAPVREVVRDVICYDVFGRTEFGGSPAVEHIAEWLS